VFIVGVFGFDVFGVAVVYFGSLWCVAIQRGVAGSLAGSARLSSTAGFSERVARRVSVVVGRSRFVHGCQSGRPSVR
jgi:hypothetical protein